MQRRILAVLAVDWQYADEDPSGGSAICRGGYEWWIGNMQRWALVVDLQYAEYDTSGTVPLAVDQQYAEVDTSGGSAMCRRGH